MAKPAQSSLHGILSIILLSSVPVLLIGLVAVYKEIQHNFKDVRENLYQSAPEKAQRINDAIAALKANLFVASQTRILQEGTPQQVKQFISELALQLPTYVKCVQLTDMQNGGIIASSCGNHRLGSMNLKQQWMPHQLTSNRNRIYVETLSPRRQPSQLQFLLSTPIYNPAGQLRYILNMQSNLQQLQPITNNAEQKSAQPLLAPVARLNTNDIQLSHTQAPHSWNLLSVTAKNKASWLPETQLILLLVIIGLSAATFIIWYLVISASLAKIRRYTKKIDTCDTIELLPTNFKIQEFQQLARAINRMLMRLKTSAKALETAWEEAQAANKVKSEFLATTSHELRTPLNAIIGCVRLVRDGCCDDREEEIDFLTRADEAAIHLLGIINDILDTTKIEAGKLSVTLEAIDLKQLLKEVINLQAIQIKQKGLELIVSDFESITVKADAAKLKQVLINVIGNAVKFTQQGSITITMQIEPGGVNTSKSQVVITVKDTGVGIDPAFQQKLFRPYVMVNATTTRNGGTGLGLAISRKLMELMNGTITLQSSGNNQGTTVAIAMPIIEASPVRIPCISAQLERSQILQPESQVV